eukprot:1937937-Pyramimonas_sp.AAC.1
MSRPSLIRRRDLQLRKFPGLVVPMAEDRVLRSDVPCTHKVSRLRVSLRISIKRLVALAEARAVALRCWPRWAWFSRVR